MSAPVRSVVFVVLREDDGLLYAVLTCGHAVEMRGMFRRVRCRDCSEGKGAPFVRIPRVGPIPAAAAELGRLAQRVAFERIYGKERGRVLWQETEDRISGRATRDTRPDPKGTILVQPEISAHVGEVTYDADGKPNGIHWIPGADPRAKRFRSRAVDYSAWEKSAEGKAFKSRMSSGPAKRATRGTAGDRA